MVLAFYIILICYVSMFNYFLPKTEFGIGVPDIDSFRAISYLLMLGAMFHWSIKKDARLFNRWIIIIAIFYTIVFASVSWSKFTYNAATLRDLFDTTFIPLFIALLSVNLFKKEVNAKIYIRHIIIAAFILSLMSVFQLASAISQGTMDLRATGTFANPNRLGIILVLSIPCLLHAKENYLIPKTFGWIATISIIAGIICSVSRKGIVTMILCFCLYYLLKKRYKIFFFTMLAFVLISISLSGFAVVGDRFERTNFTKSFTDKWEMTHAGLKMFTESPINGLGFEGYKENYSRYFPWKGKRIYDAHNMFITALANYGIIGFIPFMFILLIPLSASFKTWWRKSGSIKEHTTGMAIICLTSTIPFMVNGWFQGGLFYSAIEVSLFYANISLFIGASDE